MTTQEKKQVVNQIMIERERYGSYNRLSRVCNVSNATISNMLNGKWDSISDEIWHLVANTIGYKDKDGWSIAETYNIKQMFYIISTARETHSFWAVSCKAGSGKTASINRYCQLHTIGTYRIQAQEWTQRQFLVALANTLGISPVKGYYSVAMLIDAISDFFYRRANENPILLIDEADKLKDGAKRMLIPIYNNLEDKLACVIAGTENLEQEIKRGVRNAKKGFDEIDSRFGRTFFKLVGATFKDVAMICKANGVDDPAIIKRIFAQCHPIRSIIDGISVQIVEDIRPVKNLVRAEKVMNDKLNFS